jgi:hypothetical protein
VALLALAGCGGDEQEPVEGTGYSYSVPDGWDDVSDEAERQAGLEVAGIRPDSLVAGEREDGFAPNVNVIRESGLPPGVSAPDYAEASIAGLRDPAGAGFPPELVETIERLQPRQISATRDAELGGEEAVAWDYTSSQNGRVMRIRQLAALMDGSAYTLTLTVPQERFEDEAGALDEVVESWQWD